jgi:hypothetical protein
MFFSLVLSQTRAQSLKLDYYHFLIHLPWSYFSFSVDISCLTCVVNSTSWNRGVETYPILLLNCISRSIFVYYSACICGPLFSRASSFFICHHFSHYINIAWSLIFPYFSKSRPGSCWVSYPDHASFPQWGFHIQFIRLWPSFYRMTFVLGVSVPGARRAKLATEVYWENRCEAALMASYKATLGLWLCC